jgi:hypothetical protein
VASWSVVCTCVVHTGAECTPPLTLPPPTPLIRAATFISTTSTSKLLMGLQAHGCYLASMSTQRVAWGMLG